jgi:hypothetical protein
MKLSPHFHLSEFVTSQVAQRRGISNDPPLEVVSNLKKVAFWLEGARKILGAPILISSGYRSPLLNSAVAGSRNSDHLTGLAADFECPGHGSPERVFRTLTESGLPFDQLILEFPPDGWIHVGLRPLMRGQRLVIDSKGTRSWQP